MNYVLRSLIKSTFVFLTLILASCGSEESPRPQLVLEPVIEIETEPVAEPIETVETDASPSVDIVDEIQITIEVSDSEPPPPLTTPPDSEIPREVEQTIVATDPVTTPEDEFRSGIVNAVAYVCPKNYGTDNPCIRENTSSCVSEEKGAYRICTNRILSKYSGITYHKTEWSANHYEDTYYLRD